MLYAVDLAVDGPTTELVKMALRALACRVDAAGARIDTAVFDLGRICRLYGTVNNKYPEEVDWLQGQRWRKYP